jgi:hypothetical protein
MRYTDFKSAVHRTLRRTPAGLTRAQLQSRLHLPYNRPCPEWTRRLEEEIGLMRIKGADRALVWRVAASASAS